MAGDKARDASGYAAMAAARSMPTPVTSRLTLSQLPPLTTQQAQQGTYYGTNLQWSASNVPVASDTFVPTNDSWTMYGMLDAKARGTLTQIARAKYGSDAPIEQSWLKGLYTEGVGMSQNWTKYAGERVNPIDALYRAYVQGDTRFLEGPGGSGGGGGGGGGFGGGGGGYNGPVVQTRVTDPDTANYIVDQALETYLGRQASNAESAAFKRALAKHEIANPTVTESGPGSSVTVGGSNAQAFAEEWAQSRKGASEHSAAVGFLNTFLNALGNPVE